MARWIRFEHQGQTGFGTLDGATIRVHEGDMFEDPRPTGATLPLAEVKVLTPCTPSKMICLWNNFHALAARLGVAEPDEPLYFLKSPSAFLAHGETIRRPPSYSGNVVYEGELGIVIGKRCSNISEAEAEDHIFGYTCVDDVTAADLIPKNPTFAQWARAKSFDTFGVFGPVIATGLDPTGLSIRTVLDGQERQNYPVSDMIFQPHRLVSFLSRDMTLLPGDVIACGTSIGVSAMRGARHTIEVAIEGVGTLSNTFVQQVPFRYGEAPTRPMRIGVVGAGAIGGLMAAKLAGAGHPVTVIDQGAQLAAIQDNGLKLIWEDGSEQVARVRAVESAAEAGPQDLVILAVKAHFLDQVVRELDAMLEPGTMVMTIQNGLPWWYFQRHGGPHDGQKLESLDPSGILTRKIEPERLIGCVVYPAAQVTAPGVIRHVEGDRFPIGELDGKESERARWVHDVLVSAGLKSRILPDIRAEIWLKAWGNLSFNPISALSHATLVEICQFPETRQLAADMMREAEAVGEQARHQVPPHHREADRGRGGRRRAQDLDAPGRRARPLARDRGAGRLDPRAREGDRHPAPSIQAVYACVKLLNKVMLTEGGGVRLNKAA